MKQDYIRSSELAEKLGKDHRNLVRDITSEIEKWEKIFESDISDEFIINDKYINNRLEQEYLISSKGLEVLAYRYDNKRNQDSKDIILKILGNNFSNLVDKVRNKNQEKAKILDLLIEDDDIWIDHFTLSKLIGKRSDNVIRDLKFLIDRLKLALKFEGNFEHRANEIISFNQYKYKFTFEKVNGKNVKVYYLNREMTTELLMGYSFEVRHKIQSLFWKVSDRLKEMGYKHTNIEELNNNVDDAINILKHNAIVSAKAYVDQEKYDHIKIDNPLETMIDLISKCLEPVREPLGILSNSWLDDEERMKDFLDEIREYLSVKIPKEKLHKIDENDLIKK